MVVPFFVGSVLYFRFLGVVILTALRVVLLAIEDRGRGGHSQISEPLTEHPHGRIHGDGGVEKQRTSPHLNIHQAVYGR